MVKITNNTSNPMAFPMGNGKVEDVRPGETKDLDLDRKSPLVQGREIANAITVGTPRKADRVSERTPSEKGTT